MSRNWKYKCVICIWEINNVFVNVYGKIIILIVIFYICNNIFKLGILSFVLLVFDISYRYC